MEFKNNIKNIILLQIISPVVLLFAIILYSLVPSKGIIPTIALLLILDFLFNMLTLVLTYNQIELNKSSMIITKGLIFKKKKIILYSSIKGIEKSGIMLPGLKPFYCIIPLRGTSYNSKNDKFKIHQGYINDSDFETFEKEIQRRIEK